MEKRDLKEILDELFAGVKLDDKLAKELYNFRVRYVTQNREHAEFFGGNLLGVNKVHFKDSDRDRFFDIFNLSYFDVKEEVGQAVNIVHTYKVGGDTLNLVLMYLIHRFETHRTLSDRVRQGAKTDLALIFFYRCAAILISDYFHFQTDPKIAQRAYANLSKKFLIKELGSWNKVMDYRAKEFLGKDSPHVDTIRMFHDGVKIQYSIADSQGRIKSMILGYYAELEYVRKQGDGIGVQKATMIGEEGVEELSAKTHTAESAIHVLRQSLPDPQSFILEEQLRIISKNNTNTSVRAVRSVLEWMSLGYSNPNTSKLVDDFVSKVAVQGAYYLANNIEPHKHRDLVYVLKTLKDLFLSTRSTDPDLMEIRKLGEKIVVSALGKLSTSLMMATRTAVIMYLCLRFISNKNG